MIQPDYEGSMPEISCLLFREKCVNFVYEIGAFAESMIQSDYEGSMPEVICRVFIGAMRSERHNTSLNKLKEIFLLWVKGKVDFYLRIALINFQKKMQQKIILFSPAASIVSYLFCFSIVINDIFNWSINQRRAAFIRFINTFNTLCILIFINIF